MGIGRAQLTEHRVERLAIGDWEGDRAGESEGAVVLAAEGLPHCEGDEKG